MNKIIIIIKKIIIIIKKKMIIYIYITFYKDSYKLINKFLNIITTAANLLHQI